MKPTSFNIKLIIIAAFLSIILQHSLYSQGTDSRNLNSKQKRLYFGIYVNPLKTSISSSDVIIISELTGKGNLTVNGYLDFGYFFTPITGINIGLGYSSYSQNLAITSYKTEYQSIDSEQESFEMRISGNSISEQQNIAFLNIPVCLALRMQISEKIGVFINGGIILNIPITSEYTSSGVFTYDGYYSAYPVLLQDLAEYGFPSNLNTRVSGDLMVKSINSGFTLSSGITRSLGKNLYLVISGVFNKSLSDISEYEQNTNFRLTSEANEIKSIMEGSSGTKIQGFGLSLGFRYFLK